MKSRRKLLIGLLGLTLGCLWLAACLIIGGVSLLGPTAYNLVLSNSSLRTGEMAPDFELPTLTGETVRLSDFRGQPVLLTIGASWCIDCRNEAPMLQALHERHPELTILMVDTKEDRGTVQTYADEYGFTFPVALDIDGAVAQTYRVLAIPTELLIDESGIIRARIIEKVTEDRLTALLQKVGIEP